MCACKRHLSLGATCTCSCDHNQRLRPPSVNRSDDSVHVDWYPTYRDGEMIPKAVSLGIGEHWFVPIDPEDRRTAAAIAQKAAWATGAFKGGEDINDVIDAVQNALRSLVRRRYTPKPQEPSGRYAVVVDANGVEWLRKEPDAMWCSQNERTERGYMDAHWRKWDGINVVRVLSEGVTS